MALSIKNSQVEALVDEVVAVTGESKTEAIRRALEERRDRLALRGLRAGGRERFLRYLQEEVWPELPDEQRGRRLSRDEEEEILGLGPEGA